MDLGVPLVPFAVPCLNLFDECGLRRDTAPQALPTQMAEFDFRHVEPTAVFRRIMDLSFIRDSFRLRRIKGFIKSGFGMGIQIVHDEANLLHVRRMVIQQFFDKVRPIHFCAPRSHFGMPLTCSWFKRHKNVCGPIPLIFGVIPQRPSRFVYLGALCMQEGGVEIIHRRHRCDLSLFQLGLRFLDHLLNEDLPIPVAFYICD
jgi:hypothetical protein